MSRIVIALLVVAVFVGLIFFTDDPPGLREQFGVERWTCSQMSPGRQVLQRVAWVPRDLGLTVVVKERSSISFLVDFCPKSGDAPGCHLDWQAIRIDVQGHQDRQSFSLTRTSPGVDAGWYRKAPVSGTTAETMIAAMTRGDAMDIEMWGQNGTPIGRQHVPLAGFNAAMASCQY